MLKSTREAIFRTPPSQTLWPEWMPFQIFTRSTAESTWKIWLELIQSLWLCACAKKRLMWAFFTARRLCNTICTAHKVYSGAMSFFRLSICRPSVCYMPLGYQNRWPYHQTINAEWQTRDCSIVRKIQCRHANRRVNGPTGGVGEISEFRSVCRYVTEMVQHRSTVIIEGE